MTKEKKDNVKRGGKIFRHQRAPNANATAGRQHLKASSAQARPSFFLSDTRAKETRWATSSSIGVTPENSDRDLDPGQSFS